MAAARIGTKTGESKLQRDIRRVWVGDSTVEAGQAGHKARAPGDGPKGAAVALPGGLKSQPELAANKAPTMTERPAPSKAGHYPVECKAWDGLLRLTHAANFKPKHTRILAQEVCKESARCGLVKTSAIRRRKGAESTANLPLCSAWRKGKT